MQNELVSQRVSRFESLKDSRATRVLTVIWDIAEECKEAKDYAAQEAKDCAAQEAKDHATASASPSAQAARGPVRVFVELGW